jgi:hypothetical protein
MWVAGGGHVARWWQHQVIGGGGGGTTRGHLNCGWPAGGVADEQGRGGGQTRDV